MTFPLPEVDSCYLCGVVESLPASWNVVERTDLTVTILNGRQFEIGQCMVLPVRHAPTVLDLTQPEEAAVMSAARRVTRALVAAYAPDGVLLYQNNGVGSGQEVPHFHLHVVPRRPASDWGFGPPHIARLRKGDRPMHLDHAVVTDSKVQAVELLRRFFQ